MKKIFILIILMKIITLNVVVHADDINQTVYVTSDPTGWIKPFWGTFEFVELPAPLKPTIVNFTLEVNYEIENWEHYNDNDPWEIVIAHNTKYMEFLSDTIFIWDGPHKLGDKFRGSIEFIPLMSGNYAFCVLQKGKIRNAMQVRICFDTEGNLQFLDNLKTDLNDCNPNRVTFFNQDSVRIIQNPGYNIRQAFSYTMKVEPPFEIGDTSIVYYRLKAVNDMYNGVDLLIYSRGFELINLPEKIDYPIVKNQIVTFSLKVVPLPINKENSILIDCSSRIDTHWENNKVNSIPLLCIFNEDGSLRQITDLSTNSRKHVYPKSFPELDFKIHQKSIRINGSINQFEQKILE